MTSIIIKGKPIDDYSRCEHYHSLLDIIAVKFKCCNDYYCCVYCHTEGTDHAVQVWKKKEFTTRAILCGLCKNEMTINQYLNGNNQCISCGSKFNPNCSKHHHFYFE